MDGVLSGKYKPLDFRFFIGHTRYAKGQLEDAVVKGKYQPIACSRPLVLKQCIQLPTPLWHEGKEAARVQLCVHDSWFHSPPPHTIIYLLVRECILVLEFCGGELKEISKLELAKREDL